MNTPYRRMHTIEIRPSWPVLSMNIHTTIYSILISSQPSKRSFFSIIMKTEKNSNLIHLTLMQWRSQDKILIPCRWFAWYLNEDEKHPINPRHYHLRLTSPIDIDIRKIIGRTGSAHTTIAHWIIIIFLLRFLCFLSFIWHQNAFNSLHNGLSFMRC